MILKHENTWWGEGRRTWNGPRRVNFNYWKKNPTYPVWDFRIRVCVYTHTQLLRVLHFTYLYIHTHRDKERGGTFNTGYHFISLIFEGIVWFTWTSNYYSFSGFLWICFQLHANPSPHFSKRDHLPTSGFTNNSSACVQSQLPKFSFREGFKCQRGWKWILNSSIFHSVTYFVLRSVNTDVWWW